MIFAEHRKSGRIEIEGLEHAISWRRTFKESGQSRIANPRRPLMPADPKSAMPGIPLGKPSFAHIHDSQYHRKPWRELPPGWRHEMLISKMAIDKTHRGMR